MIAFDGRALADPRRIRTAAARLASVQEDGNHVVAVLSAMGDATDELLIAMAEDSLEKRGFYLEKFELAVIPNGNSMTSARALPPRPAPTSRCGTRWASAPGRASAAR